MGKERRRRMKVQKLNMGAWASLPSDVFFQIVSRLPCLEDFSRLSTVCKSWNFSVKSSEKPSLSLKTPVLMIVEERETEDKSIKVKAQMEITDLSSKFPIHVWRLELSTPLKRCFGVKYGWLLTVGMDLQICLVHPISELQINLPPCPNSEYLLDPQYHNVTDSDQNDSGVLQLPRLRNTVLWKAALSSNPLENITSRRVSDECVIMAIFSDMGMLGFARMEDKAWTIVNCVSHDFVDVIYFEGKFYSVNNDGALFVCKIDEETPRAYKIASVEADTEDQKFLVESYGCLFLIIRIPGSGAMRTVPIGAMLYPWPEKIFVYSLEESSFEESGYDFEREPGLGNMSFMLGASSVSVDAPPGIKGCFKRNRIFVTDDIRDEPPDGMDVFDLGERTSEGFDFSRYFKSLSLSCPPFWYV